MMYDNTITICWEELPEEEKASLRSESSEKYGFTPDEFRVAMKPLALFMFQHGVKSVAFERFDGAKFHSSMVMNREAKP
jgi:hypothetical protein